MTRNRQPTRGFTLLELLAVLAVLAVLLGIAALNLRDLNNPLENAARQVSATLNQARARAMTTTSAVRLTLSGATLSASRAPSCTDTSWTADSSAGVTLTEGTAISALSPNRPICFDSRGLPDNAYTLTLSGPDGRTRRVRLFLGGAVTQE